MKPFILLMLLAGVLIPSLCGDDFEDLIQECARVSANYNRAVSSANTRFDKEYRSYLDHLKQLSRKVQSTIRELELGNDFNFPLLADELEHIYQEAQERKEQQKSSKQRSSSRSQERNPGKLLSYSSSPEGIFRILAADMNALRKMKFTTEDGGSIAPSLETRRRLAEFRRLLDFFRKNYRSARTGRQKQDVSMERIFDSRMQRLSSLATVLMQSAKASNPDSQLRCNLNSETEQMIKCFQEWRDLPPAKSQHRRKNLSHTNSPAALLSEIDLSIRNINEQLTQWDHSSFQSDRPLRKAGRSDVSEDPAALLRQPVRSQDYSSMDQAALTELLNRRRQAVIRSNSSMDGFDRDAERMYLLSLSRDQKRVYQAFLRDYQQRGYSSGQAVRNAVLKMQTQILIEKTQLPAKEMIQLLQAMDKETALRQEKDRIQFKVGRGGERVPE